MLLIALLMTSSELPAATANIPLPQLRQDVRSAQNADAGDSRPRGDSIIDDAGDLHIQQPEQ